MALLLVVDDEHPMRAFVAVSLRRAGHTVIAAADGATARELFVRERPDLLLLDTRMPGLDGFQLYDELQAHDVRSDLPVIFLAVRFADAGAWQQHEGPNLSRTGRPYLVKPFSPEALVEAVERELFRGAPGSGA